MHGVKEWKQLGISTRKLVVDLPLYGYMYDYICPTPFADNTCTIKAVPHVVAPCSDAARKQLTYKDIVKNFLPISMSVWLYNTSQNNLISIKRVRWYGASILV